MPAATTTDRPSRTEVREAIAGTVERYKLAEHVKAWGPARVLAAIGHPGYSAAYAAVVLVRMHRSGYDAFQVIYNGWGAES